MLKQERFHHILDRLRQRGQIQLGPLSLELQVSEDTVRRDIDELGRQGLLTKVRGGALPSSPIPNAFQAREQHDAAAKQEIAQKARALIQDGQLLILDGGTTAGWLARSLSGARDLTVATNSLAAANVLLEYPDVSVRLAGGQVHTPYRVTLGLDTVDFFRRLRADYCFLGAYGLHPEAGLTVADPQEAEVKRAMVGATSHVVALITPEKLGAAARYVACEAGAIHTLITTDALAGHPDLDTYRELGIRIL